MLSVRALYPLLLHYTPLSLSHTHIYTYTQAFIMAEENGEEVERLTAESYGALDTTHVADECWMIRIPPKLAELWEKAPEGTDLGELIFTKGGTHPATKRKVKPSLTVHVSEALVQEHHRRASDGSAAAPPAAAAAPPKPATTTAATTTIPLNYSLQAMTKKVPVMHPFIRNPVTGSVDLLGTVSRTANLQVDQDSNYRALLKDRLVATALTSNRFVKPVEASESVIAKQRSTAALALKKKRGFGDAVLQYGKRMLEASQESSLLMQQQQQQGKLKKARQFSPDQPIRSVVFELFGQQTYWTVKDLKAAAVAGGASNAGTKRAEAEIRDVLREIGEYHRSGDHKNMWELRKEFQRQT